MSFVGTFIVGENNIVCRQGDQNLNGIPAGRWCVVEWSAYHWKLSAPGYGNGQDESNEPLYLSKERYGKGLPSEFVPEPLASVDLMQKLIAMGDDSQARLDEAIQLYINRYRVLSEWVQATHLDEYDSLGVIPQHD